MSLDSEQGNPNLPPGASTSEAAHDTTSTGGTPLPAHSSHQGLLDGVYGDDAEQIRKRLPFVRSQYRQQHLAAMASACSGSQRAQAGRTRTRTEVPGQRVYPPGSDAWRATCTGDQRAEYEDAVALRHRLRQMLELIPDARNVLGGLSRDDAADITRDVLAEDLPDSLVALGVLPHGGCP